MADIRIQRLADDYGVRAETECGQDFIESTFDLNALAWERGDIILSPSCAADLATLALAADLTVRLECGVAA
jgi:hypothetical protein